MARQRYLATGGPPLARLSPLRPWSEADHGPHLPWAFRREERRLRQEAVGMTEEQSAEGNSHGIPLIAWGFEGFPQPEMLPEELCMTPLMARAGPRVDAEAFALLSTLYKAGRRWAIRRGHTYVRQQVDCVRPTEGQAILWELHPTRGVLHAASTNIPSEAQEAWRDMVPPARCYAGMAVQLHVARMATRLFGGGTAAYVPRVAWPCPHSQDAVDSFFARAFQDISVVGANTGLPPTGQFRNL